MTLPKQLTLAVFFTFSLLSIENSLAQNPGSKKSRGAKGKSLVASYEKYIDGQKDDHIKEFIELVSIPSVSSNKAEVERAADWLVNKLKSIGMTTAQVLPTDGNPVVYGSWEIIINDFCRFFDEGR